MKKIKQVLFIALIVALGCKSKQDKLVDYVPGIYVKPIHHEFADGQDTLAITPIESGENSFKIERRSSYVRYWNGKTLPLKNDIENWIGVLDPQTGIMMEQRHGKVITFDSKQHCLFVGGTKYQKTP